jgi:hypothetical protein
MKSLTIRLPDEVASRLEAEARRRKTSKSEIVRERLASQPNTSSSTLDSIADLIGSVDGLPSDLSRNKKAYLKALGYGRKRPR